MIDSRLQSLINAGAPLVRLGKGQKSPTEKGWSTTPTLTPTQYTANAAEWFGTGFNAGVRTGYPLNNGGFLVVVDVDVRSQAPEHIKQIKTALAGLGLDGVLHTVLSGRGGGSAHIYMRCTDELVLSKGVWTLAESADSVDVPVADGKIEQKKAWMIDLVSKGKQVVCPPSTHPDTGKAYEWVQGNLSIIDMPPQLLARVQELSQSRNAPSKAQGLTLPKMTQDFSALPKVQGLQELPTAESPAEAARVKSALAKISADCSRNDWMAIVFALAWTGWDCAYTLAYEWSASAPAKFDAQAFDVLWNSHNPVVSPTLRTLFARAKAAGWVDETLPAYIEELNTEFFTVTHGGKFRVCRERDMVLLSKNDFLDLCRPRTTDIIQNDQSLKRVEIAPLWLKHLRHRHFNCMQFSPECGVQPNAYGCFNLYRGWGITPTTVTPKSLTGNFTVIIDYLRDGVCGGKSEEFTYLMLWLHKAVTQLDRPLGVAVVLQGGKGIGKSTLGTLLCEIFGQHARHITQTKQITGQFNSQLEDCLFLFADEAVFAGDRVGEQVLKAMITERTLTIERKGMDAYQAVNHVRMIIATNNAVAVNASGDERRYFIPSISEAYAQDKIYFDRLHGALKNGGAEDLLGFLLSDYCAKLFTGKDLRYCIPKTDKLNAHKVAGLHGIPAVFYEALHAEGVFTENGGGHSWTDGGMSVPVPTLTAHMHSQVDKWDAKGLSRELGKFISTHQLAEVKRESSGNRPRLYKFAPLNEARRIFATKVLRDPEHDWGA